MSTEYVSMSAADGRRLLVDSFEAIWAYKAQQKEIGEAIKETKESICARLNIAPKGFDLALKYWTMTEGERMDFDTVLTMAQQALSDDQQDLFEDRPVNAIAEGAVKNLRRKMDQMGAKLEIVA